MDTSAVRNEALNQLSLFEQLKLATTVLTEEAEALSRLSKKLPDDFSDAVQLISECKGSVIVTGVGKAGWIGQKISASFASTGTRSHFLHPAEAIHGDLGRVGPNDVVLFFSNSGETGEVVRLLPTLEKLKTPLIAITAKHNSTLASKCHAVLNYGKQTEACPLGLAPTTSTTLMLGMGDALMLVVSRAKQFRAMDFAKFHPGGSLGKQLSIVDDVMRPLAECRVAIETETVREVFVRLGGKARRAGAVLVTDDNDKLTGIFTDSDLAKLLEQQMDQSLDEPIKSVMTCSPVTVKSGSKTGLAVETLAVRNLSELPVVNGSNEPIGIVEITDVVSVSSMRS